MIEVSDRVLAMYVIGVIAILQSAAWLLGKNGAMFALTSNIVTGIGVYFFTRKVNAVKPKP
jgi:hypothetical protein